MSEQNIPFKKGLFGFKPEKVMDYVDELLRNSDFDQIHIAELEKKISDNDAVVADIVADRDSAINELRAAINEREMRIAELEKEIREVAKNASASSETKCADCDVQKKAQALLGETLFDVKRFTLYLVNDAKQKANATISDAQGTAGVMSERAKEILYDVDGISNSFASQINELRMALAGLTGKLDSFCSEIEDTAKKDGDDILPPYLDFSKPEKKAKKDDSALNEMKREIYSELSPDVLAGMRDFGVIDGDFDDAFSPEMPQAEHDFSAQEEGKAAVQENKTAEEEGKCDNIEPEAEFAYEQEEEAAVPEYEAPAEPEKESAASDSGYNSPFGEFLIQPENKDAEEKSGTLPAYPVFEEEPDPVETVSAERVDIKEEQPAAQQEKPAEPEKTVYSDPGFRGFGEFNINTLDFGSSLPGDESAEASENSAVKQVNGDMPEMVSPFADMFSDITGNSEAFLEESEEDKQIKMPVFSLKDEMKATFDKKAPEDLPVFNEPQEKAEQNKEEFTFVSPFKLKPKLNSRQNPVAEDPLPPED